MNKKYLTFENVFKETFSLLKTAGIKIFAAELIMAIPFIIPFYFVYSSGIIYDWNMEEMVGGVIISIAFCVLGGIILGPLFIYYCVKTLNNVATGITESVKDIIIAGFKKILPLWGTYIIYGVIVSLALIPFMVIIGITAFISTLIPGSGIITAIIMIIGMLAGYVLLIWMAIAFSYSFYILMLEDKTIEQSLKGSWELTKKRCGKIFLIGFVTILVFYIGVFLIFALTGGARMFMEGLSGADTMTYINSFQESSLFWIIYTLFIFVVYPFFFSFYTSIYINLKREKGTFHSNELVNNFMEEDSEEELW